MAESVKLKTSVSLDKDTLNAARELRISVSAVAEDALRRAVAEARQRRWQEENAATFAAQAEWHERHGHPLADIMAGPAGSTWKD